MVRSVRGSSRAWQIVRSKKRRSPRIGMMCYRERKIELLGLGYKKYSEYLEGELWQAIRAEKLKGNARCVICGFPANQIHHLSYDLKTLLGKCLHRLVPLCRDCHVSIEFSGTKKQGLKEANQELFRLAVRNEWGQHWLSWYKEQEIRERCRPKVEKWKKDKSKDKKKKKKR